MPSISRRELLGGTAALAGGSYGAYRLYRGRRDASFDSWTPEEGTWPLPRYDPANTAHNPNASPPREEPTRRELASVKVQYARPLIGPEYYAVVGDRFEMFPAEGGEAVLTDRASTPSGGFGPEGRFHAVHRSSDGEGGALAGYDGGEQVYRHALGDNPHRGFTLGATEVYVGTFSGMNAFHPGNGHDWTVSGEMPALANGRLYVTGTRDGTAAYEPRDGIDRRISIGPKRAWSGEWIGGQSYYTTVADGRLIAGTFGFRTGGEVVAHDVETGERLWEPRSFGTDDSDTNDVSTPAVVGERGYVAAGIDGLDAGAVACLDLTNGETVWRDDTEWYAANPVVGDEDTLVVTGDVRTGENAPAMTVRAYDTASGDRLWTETFDGDYGSGLALAGDSVFVGASGTLYELA